MRESLSTRAITEGTASLGIELGSTRIKAVLVDESHKPIASGNFDWENKLENGFWTYSLEDVTLGLHQSYKKLVQNVTERYGVQLRKIRGLGISAMMHGYLAFDRNKKLLVPFRTWRNTTTEQAAMKLTELFGFNIPLRWSAAHLYQAILNKETHVGHIRYVTTLAGYVHWMLTGQFVLGIGDASGMFPIDSAVNCYNGVMKERFDSLLAENGLGFGLADVFPKVLSAGDDAGFLTAEGALLLDPDGNLEAGAPMAPPEGDAGTGMVATNSVAVKTGNVSAGTSVFAMAVLEDELKNVYPEIDMVTTPDGKPVAMVHCNNCTSDIDAWVKMFAEYNELCGIKISKPQLYDLLYESALTGDSDCGGLLSYNYYSGEPITGLEQGRPLFARTPDARYTVANLMRSLLFSSMTTLKIGMDILSEKENVKLTQLNGHGGLFKTKVVAQRLMAAALNVPMAVMESAGEGGAWGMAILAAYRAARIDGTTRKSLPAYLSGSVFADSKGSVIEPDSDDFKGFARYMDRYIAGLSIERAAASDFNNL